MKPQTKKISVNIHFSRLGLLIGFLLFPVFAILKITNVIHWSWIWVSSPIWISITVGYLIPALITGLLAAFLAVATGFISVLWLGAKRK